MDLLYILIVMPVRSFHIFFLIPMLDWLTMCGPTCIGSSRFLNGKGKEGTENLSIESQPLMEAGDSSLAAKVMGCCGPVVARMVA